MNKVRLLARLAETQERAEKAKLDVIVLSKELAEIKARGSAFTGVVIGLKAAENEEQKRLREMTWILDQLDQKER
jgi:hypothetical protein